MRPKQLGVEVKNEIAYKNTCSTSLLSPGVRKPGLSKVLLCFR